VLNKVAEYEDSRVRSLDMMQLNDEATVSSIQARGDDRAAAAVAYESQARYGIKALRPEDPDYEEKRSLILNVATNRLKRLQRDVGFEELQGQPREVLGGTFAPTRGTNRPWEEDKDDALTAIGKTLDSVNKLRQDPTRPGTPDFGQLPEDTDSAAFVGSANALISKVDDLITAISGN
jgi:hypothetical protein